MSVVTLSHILSVEPWWRTIWRQDSDNCRLPAVAIVVGLVIMVEIQVRKVLS